MAGIAGHHVGHQIGLRDRRIERALEGDLGGVQRSGDDRDHRDLLAPYGPDVVGGADVERGVQVSEVAHRPPLHRKVAGHRTDLQGVTAAYRFQRTRWSVGLPGLAELNLSAQLNVGLARSEPDVVAHLHAEVRDGERIEEPVLELAAEVLPPKEGGVDQIRDGGVLEIDDPLGHQVGEVEHAAVRGEAPGEIGMEERAFQLQGRRWRPG